MIRPLLIVIQEYNKIMYNISNYRKIEKVIIQKIDMYNIEMISIFISALPDKVGSEMTWQIKSFPEWPGR